MRKVGCGVQVPLLRPFVQLLGTTDTCLAPFTLDGNGKVRGQVCGQVLTGRTAGRNLGTLHPASASFALARKGGR